MKKKILAFLLSAVMIVSLLPTVAFADTHTHERGMYHSYIWGYKFHQHKGQRVSPKAATCEDYGVKKTCYVCSCGKFFKDSNCWTEINVAVFNTYFESPLGHNFSGDVQHVGDGEHNFACVNEGCGKYGCDGVEGATEDCYGGEATCMEKACCEKCGEEYGDLGDHDFSGDAQKAGEGKHNFACVNEGCDKYGYNDIEGATVDCYGGEATCMKKACCEECGEEYGDLDPEAHTFSQKWSKDSTHHWHAATCIHKDQKADYAEHTDSNKDGKCDKCGAKLSKPTAPVKISVSVKDKTETQYIGFWPFGYYKNVKTYTATIKTEATGTKVTKVQYQLNGGRWTTGTSVSSDKPINSLKVRVTDSNGKVYDYTYGN